MKKGVITINMPCYIICNNGHELYGARIINEDEKQIVTDFDGVTLNKEDITTIKYFG